MIDHHDSITALITSARDGCHLCTLLLARIAQIGGHLVKDMQSLEVKDRISKRRVDESPTPSYHVQVKGHIGYRNAKLEYKMSIQQVAIAKLHLNQQLLYLLSQGFDRYKYLTLSHKWGGASILKLTKSNIEPMLQYIDIDDLPLTFQHAITITRNLDYQYLWIDSLCIIQDDPSDWAFESATMSRVYSNSVLTIAALWGDDSHSGCFVERNPFVTENSRIGTWKHGNVICKSDDQKRTRFLNEVKPTPLLRRAWVLQERFLSPRTLFYGPWELHWECGERTTNELHPERTTGLQGDMLKTRFRRMSGTNLIVSKPSSLESTRKRIQDNWRHLCRHGWAVSRDGPQGISRLERNHDLWTEIRRLYWDSRLTHHSDILVAISGITDVIEQKTGLHFVFGLCKEFLCSELLWEVRNANETIRSNLGPTWSWASVEKAQLRGGYYFNKDEYKSPTFHTWTESVSDSEGRDLSFDSNSLRLRGPLLHTTLERDNDGELKTKNSHLPKYDYIPDIPLPDTIDVVCLLVVTWGVDLKSRLLPVNKYWAGLILVPSPREDSAYERVGAWGHVSSNTIGSNIMPRDIQSFWLV
ncbi:MAG: hypothetical protein Q9215_004843 [Flavoplaca cf. flavocitrina]